MGHLKVVADSSQIWWILVATGLAVGGIAAGIDVVSDWLGDLKTGFCSNVDDGGKFYLNRAFCCWETETYAECHDWRAWAQALGIGNEFGSYVVEYMLFVCYSVSVLLHLLPNFPLTTEGPLRHLRQLTRHQIFPLRQTKRHTRD